MANSVAAVKNYTTILDEVYQRVAVSHIPNSPRRMAREAQPSRCNPLYRSRLYDSSASSAVISDASSSSSLSLSQG